MPLAPGTRVGPYEVAAAIGAGGMGEVYRAKDTKLNRDVALKILPEALAADPDRLARFRREAQVLASLNHPNIGHIYGFEDSGSTHALVLEFVDGPTLAELIGPRHAAPAAVALSESASRDAAASGSGAPRGLKIDDALKIARQIAEALDAAHAQGIVHRDLKPANIKVRDDGTVKVLDFGLAKAVQPDGLSATADAANSPTMMSPAMTSMGMILGTAAYMAPEQARGQPVDKRADIWAFGVVLYEMLTGRRCFDGATVSDVLAAVLRAEIDWSALPADTPRSLRRLLARCLERDPRPRLRDIGDASTDLELNPSDEPGAGSPPVTIRRPSAPARWLPWVVAVAASGAVVTWAWLRTPPTPVRVVTRAQITLKDRAAAVSVSRDGTRLAYATSVRTSAVSSPSLPFVMLRMLDEVDATPIPGSEGALAALFSPDGRWIAYTQLQPGAGQSVSFSIKKIPITGGTSIALCDGSFIAGGAWGDDDTIVFSGDKGLMRVSAAGGTPEPLTAIDGAKGEARHARPQFLPGGRQLLFTITSTKPADVPQFAVLDLATGRYRVVAKSGGNGRYVKSGHLTYVRGTTLFAVPFDVSRLAVTGDEVPVVEGVSSVRGNGLSGDYSVSDAGLLVYVTANSSVGSQSTLAWASRTGTTEALPGESRQRWGTGRLSPDGRRLANAIHNGDGTSDIWILDVQRGTTTRLTFSGRADDPIWTPDGSRIVYATDPNQKSALYSVPADGSSKPDLLIAVGQPAVPNSFTPDGKTLLYEAGPGSAVFRIFVLPLTASGTAGASRPWHEGAGGESNAQVSPDGRWVAYVSNESGQSDVYVQAFSGVGAKWHVSTLGCPGERWSRSSTHDELLYHCGAPNWPFVSVEMPADVTLGPSAPHELFRLQSGGTWDVTPDRDRLLVELVSGGDRPGTTIETVTDWFEELRRLAPAKK